jgi:hypothetical protein
MRCTRWSVALAALAATAAPAPAQILIGPGYGGPFVRVGATRRHVSLSIYAGAVWAPPVYCPPVGRIVVYTPPPLLMPASSNPLLDAIIRETISPSVEPLPDLPPEARWPDRMPPPARQLLPPAPPEQPPPQPAPAPPPPEKKEPPKKEREQPAPEKPAPPKAPQEKKPPAPRRELPSPPLPEDDPKAESARLLALGQAAFADAEYGRAAGRFRQAVAAAPDEPVAHFLLAQALMALGKYVDAANAIHAGLALQPDWPAFRFRPLDLYGTNVADYSDHLHRLEEVLRRHPDDPVLLFVRAYQLWWDGRRDEAREFLERARRAGADPADIDHFLRFLPATPVL